MQQEQDIWNDVAALKLGECFEFAGILIHISSSKIADR